MTENDDGRGNLEIPLWEANIDNLVNVDGRGVDVRKLGEEIKCDDYLFFPRCESSGIKWN